MVRGFVAGIFIFIVSVADAWSDASTPPMNIERIGTGWGGEGIYITSKQNHIVENCLEPVLYINASHPMLDEMLSLALSAFHSGAKVQFRISGCEYNRMNVIALEIQK